MRTRPAEQAAGLFPLYPIRPFKLLKFDNLLVVGVAQLAEHRVVAPVVVGSNPITHPIFLRP